MDKQLVNDYVNSAASYAREATRVCSRCGLCLSACTVYMSTRDPRLSPMSRLRAAAKVLNGGSFTDDDVLALYTCNQCGACTQVCPYAIEVLRVVHAARIVLASKGVYPEGLRKVSESARRAGHSFTPNREEPVKLLVEIAREVGIKPDESADILYVPSPFETTVYPHVLRDTLLLFKKLGLSVTVSTRALDSGGNVAIDANDLEAGFMLLKACVEEAERLGARTVLLSQCGADTKLVILLYKLGVRLGGPRVANIYEFFAERGFRATCTNCILFTSCTFARLDPKRSLEKTIVARKPRDKPPYTMCCGGAGGLNFLHEEPFASIRKRVYRWRFERLLKSAKGATIVLPCVKCYSVLRHGALLAKKPTYPMKMYTSVALEEVSSASQP
ncbi:(Fe-S)-binding protein [Pyrolobus fumarii]|nr:(Fe-S)-binding protein [Pyrolobus fumarii]